MIISNKLLSRSLISRSLAINNLETLFFNANFLASLIGNTSIPSTKPPLLLLVVEIIPTNLYFTEFAAKLTASPIS